MKRYWDQPEKTAQAVVNGWMNTEDLATIDEDGYCRIVGRTKDMIIRGGENIYPREIEEFLYEHPDIIEAQVIGVPDKKVGTTNILIFQFGEEVCVWIQKKPESPIDKEEVIKFCKGKIAHYKIPKFVFFTENFPMTITGKIQKVALREMTVKELN